jgi:hypothetical protein
LTKVLNPRNVRNFGKVLKFQPFAFDFVAIPLKIGASIPRLKIGASIPRLKIGASIPRLKIGASISRLKIGASIS